jgi:signal transduction histidine kinase
MRSLYFRVFVITIYTITLSSLLGFIVSNAYYHWKLKPYNDAKLSGMAGHIREFVQRNPELLHEYLQNAADLGYQLYIYGDDGTGTFYGSPFRKPELPQAVVLAVLAGGQYHGVAQFPSHLLITGYFKNSLENSVGLPLEVGDKRYALFLRPDVSLQFGELRIFFAMILVLSILFSIPYFLLSTRYLVQPITFLTEATKRIAQGDFNLRLATKRRDEIGQLASHFQIMSSQLERSDKARKEFVANVSHEIHSPLASIQGFADTLLQDGLDNGQKRYYAGIIGQEARHLTALSRQLLLLSKLDHDKDAIAKTVFPVKIQLRQSLKLLEWQLTDKGLAVRMQVPAELYVFGDEVLLMQVWSNLLSNAVKHIAEGRSIEIKASEENGFTIVHISDNGDGIPEEQLPFIFDRFYRGDGARQRGAGSTGLGLSIVWEIVKLHGGEIKVKSGAGEGTTFSVRLPIVHKSNERAANI